MMAVLIVGAGCFQLQPDLQSPDPALRIPAMQDVVHDGRADPAVLKQLVTDLNSDDAAVRFYAIKSLERLTGRTFEYRYYDSEEARQASVSKWQQWLDEPPGTTGGGDLPSK